LNSCPFNHRFGGISRIVYRFNAFFSSSDEKHIVSCLVIAYGIGKSFYSSLLRPSVKTKMEIAPVKKA
jgi:hypothetical protein